ncbi:MAG: hypothetical protein WC780_18365 [Lentimicrobiaceae bacterium]
MELKIDLLKQEKKSVFRIVIGILFILVSIVWAVSRYNNNRVISAVDWFFFGIMVLNGLTHIWGGFGLPLIRVFGESYVWIDDIKISIKTRVLGKEHSILWVDIKLINYKLNRFKVIRTNDTTLTLDFSKLEYSIVKDAKEIIGNMAKEKGIQINL